MWKTFKNSIIKKIAKWWSRELGEWDVDKQGMEEMIKAGTIIVDVRSPQEYREGHIDGAILLPEYDIKRNANLILKNKDETILVYCTSGNRSKKAQKELNKMGYSKVYNLAGGIELFL